MMAAAYSLDLRRKVVEACERRSCSQVEVARFFGVSKPFVDKVLRQYRETGRFEPERKRPGRHTLIDAVACEQVQRWLDEQSDLTLAELADRLKARHGLQVSVSCVWRLLRRLGLRRKKRVSMLLSATHRRYYWHASNTARNWQAASQTT
jgi:transposase